MAPAFRQGVRVARPSVGLPERAGLSGDLRHRRAHVVAQAADEHGVSARQTRSMTVWLGDGRWSRHA